MLFPFLRIFARMRSRRFDHIVTLGYNCELAARFFECFKFVDATLFCWAAAPHCEEMCHALEHPDEIFSGEIDIPRKDFPLFRCKNTNVRAHGRAKMNVWLSDTPPTKEFVDAEIAELVSRIAHLRKKTFDYLRDDKSVLVILKIKPAECKPGCANDTVRRYINTLNKIGTRNMTFLVICEESMVPSFEGPHPDFELRAVAEYNPESNAADLKRGDSRGWRLIFDEFRPKTIKKQTHKFKFEEDDGHR